MRILQLAAAAALSIAIAGQATAATVVVSETFDVSEGFINGYANGSFQAVFDRYLTSVVTLSQGDTLELNFQLTPGQHLAVSGLDYLRVYLAADDADPNYNGGFIRQNTGALTFLSGGAIVGTSDNVTHSNHNPTAELWFYNADHLNLATDFTFDEVRMVISIDQPSVTRRYGSVGLMFNGASSDEINGGVRNALPEPSTWALLIMGFGGIGALLRKRQNGQVGALQPSA